MSTTPDVFGSELRAELRDIDPTPSNAELDDLVDIAERIQQGEFSLPKPTDEGLERNRTDFLEQVKLRND